MDGWKSGWMDGWMGRWVDGWMDGQMGGSMDANPAGFDTKIMRNCGKIHLKRTKIDLLMNRLVILVSCLEPPHRSGKEHRRGKGKGPSPQKPQLSLFRPQFPSFAKHAA